MRYFLLCFCFICLPAQANCIPGGVSELEKLRDQHAEIVLHFFSTWCADCAVHLGKLKDTRDQNQILISTFDKLDRVNKSLKKLNIQLPCIHDNGELAKYFKIKNVPAQIVWKK